MGASAMATGDPYCVHGLPLAVCITCSKPMPAFAWPIQHPSIAGHCGKCGAPYTMDMTAGLAPAKFVPSCKCWNV